MKLSVAAKVKECQLSIESCIPVEILRGKEPIIMRGLVNKWPAVTHVKNSEAALAEYLEKFDAELPLTVYTSEERGGKIGYKADYTGFNFERHQATLRLILKELLLTQRDGTLYVGSTMVDRWLPGFRTENDIGIDHLKPLISFWIGNQTNIAAHYDCPANIACCVAGKRTFTLFPPDQITNLYIGPVDITPSGRAISLVDFDQPDLEKFPRFPEAMAHSQVAELMPGDALYLPPLWWHHVKSQSRFNMLVNYWWKSNPDYMGNPDFALEHAILAMRGLPSHQKTAWKALFDHYVFNDPDVAVAHIPEHIRGILNSTDERSVRLGWVNLSKKLKS